MQFEDVWTWIAYALLIVWACLMLLLTFAFYRALREDPDREP